MTPRRPRLLLVEDHREMRRALSRLFASVGWDVAECRDLPEGYAAMAPGHGTYDAAVIDLMLPGGDGAGLVAALREAGGATRIIVYTACHYGDHRVREAVAAGASAVAFKPVEFEKVLLPLALGTYVPTATHAYSQPPVLFPAPTAPGDAP